MISEFSTQSTNIEVREILFWSVVFGLLTILLHIPFLFRYDLYFQSDLAVCHLQAKRILFGEFTVYNWGCDYGGIGPIDFLTAGLFAVFGASIPLSGFVSLLFWAAGVAVLTGYTMRYFGKRAAIASGCALAVGVPHVLMYSSQPLSSTYPQAMLYIGGFIWLTTLILKKGPQSWLCALTAFIMGWFWYAHKQVLVVWLSIGVTLLLLPQGRKFLNQFMRSKMALVAIISFIAGYSPEIYYKLGFTGDSHERVGDASSFLQLASFEIVTRNWYMIFRCILTYFNADPWSRSPSSVHYLNHMENWESFPQEATDTIGIIAAILVIGFIIRMMVQSHREKDFPVLILATLPIVNMLVILIAAKSGGSYYNIRRYLLPAGIACWVWLGIRFNRDWESRRWISCVVLALTVFISLIHQYRMLLLPDELTDYKATVMQIEERGYKYGLSWFPFSHTLTALSNERVSFGIVDRRFQSPYQKPAFASDVVAVVWPVRTPPPFEFAQKLFFGEVKLKNDSMKVLPDTVTFLGVKYQRVGDLNIVGELGWAPYRKS